ncbi:hypothetical protein [Comamonas terrigena]|uniref:hypothetical protein n=1 Tax=Comamonas terrigena TaxID=32013 RepID=UPI0023559D43|nr:hypothetical protein [Comamonas terrigena]MDH0050642.1 hypothetical protein [Comamonas terrigena]MDH0513098.1 hypothetical protein [Comamonas terrigena]MDH1092574.1 hypothetical protein [Comamonas terrigena]
MEFNFTDGSAEWNIASMPHEPSPTAAVCPPLPEPVANPPQVYRHMVVCLQRCARTAAVHALDALRRAEKRITENFRVPPHGG